MAQTRTASRGDTSDTGQSRMTEIQWDLSKLAGRDLMDVWLDIGNEFSRFIAARIREDVNTQHRILHCGSSAELQQIQLDFLQKAVRDYTAETGRLVELGRRLGSDRSEQRR